MAVLAASRAYTERLLPPLSDNSKKQPVRPDEDIQTSAGSGNWDKHSSELKFASYSTNKALVWVIAGGMSAVVAGPFIASILSSYGIILASQKDGLKAQLSATLVGCLSAILVGIFLGMNYVPAALISILVSSGYVAAHSKKIASMQLECLVVLLGTLALLAVDAVIAWQSGQTLQAYVQTIIQTSLSALGSATPDASIEYAVTLSTFLEYWPMAYLVQVLCMIVGARIGVRAVQRKYQVQQKDFPVRDLSMPWWVSLAFVAGVILMAVGPRFGFLSELMMLVGRNVLMAARLALAIQGIAVVLRVLSTMEIGHIGTFLVVIAAALIEKEFFFLSALGFVDTFAKFRRFVDTDTSDYESKKSA